MATVVHRYEPSPLSVEKAAERKAAEQRREEATRRKEEAKRSAARSANRGAAILRKERAAHEKLKRMRLEMEVAVRRNELILKSTVERQAGFVFISLRQAILGFPSRYARQVVGVADLHQAREVLTRAAHEFLNELSGFAEKLTANPDWVADENGAPLAEDDGGQADEGVASSS